MFYIFCIISLEGRILCKDLVGKFKKIIENDIVDDLYKINDELRECRYCFFFKFSNSC